jgi:hypothetical protein
MLQRLDAVELGEHELLQLCVVVSKEPIPDLFDKILRAGRGGFSLAEVEPTERDFDVLQFHLRRKFGRKHVHSVAGEFLVAPTGFENTHLFIWIEPVRFWSKGMSPFLDAFYPKLVRPFFTQPEMHRFMRNVETAGRMVRVLRSSTRERLKQPGSRRQYASAVRWTDMDIETAFRSAQQENFLFRNISFELVREVEDRIVSEGIRAKIAKNGYFSCTGAFELFSRTIVYPMVKSGHERLAFFGNRDRLATSFNGPRPIKIRYDFDIFKSADQTRKLLETMKRFKHGTCSVLHANPYLHVSLVDNYDNSSADVWVLAKSEVLIVPQIKTSAAALKRVVSHIFEDFREGTIAEESVS